MSTLIEAIKEMFASNSRVDFRDRDAHYASGNLTCLRDQYWTMKKVPETNPTDFIGSMKMMVGSAIEKGLVDIIKERLHFLGWHTIGTQIPVGQSKPKWTGYLDLFMTRHGENGWENLVVEIKTKSGFGASKLARVPEPSLEYLTQIGLYLRSLTKKGDTNHGLLLYVLLSDATFGQLVAIYCTYDEQTDTVTASHYENSNGMRGTINVKVDLAAAVNRWVRLDKHLADNIVPEGEYKYKYELTPEVLRELSDTALKGIIEGTAVHGDWQPLYSRYKNLQLETDKISPERTDEERGLARAEYRRRHPRSKI